MGVFPFLALPRELRDIFYDYATAYTKPLSDKVVRVRRVVSRDYHDFTGLVLTCRQIHAEYRLRHANSKRLGIGIQDSTDYITTFFPSAKPIARELALTVFEDDAGSNSPGSDILQLIEWSLRDPKLSFRFVSAELRPRSPWQYRHASDLNNSVIPRIIHVFNLDAKSGVNDRPFTRTTLNAIRLQFCCMRTWELEFIFNAEGAAPWMTNLEHTWWLRAGEITNRIEDLESGDIPQGYLSEDEVERIRFCERLGLHDHLMLDTRLSIAMEETNQAEVGKRPWSGSDERTWQQWVWGALESEEYSEDDSWTEEGEEDDPEGEDDTDDENEDEEYEEEEQEAKDDLIDELRLLRVRNGW